MTSEVKTIAERNKKALELLTKWQAEGNDNNIDDLLQEVPYFTIEQVEEIAREAHGIGAYRQQDFCDYWQQKKQSLIKGE